VDIAETLNLVDNYEISTFPHIPSWICPGTVQT
jgi:hypothetical protein